ncbi:hypothetical protein ERO13_1Z049374v2 [Gossypium hirsutum]|nr:hypothetical protein ERO13_1Z049374v2 [Gossypium hirsutum]
MSVLLKAHLSVNRCLRIQIDEKICLKIQMIAVTCAADWRFAAEKFVAKLPDKVIEHRSECNYSKLTFDGVDMMGERLAQEVIEYHKYLHFWTNMQCSIGCCQTGLVARYAIGRLYENSTKLGQSGPFNCWIGTNEFITFATPHLGSRGHKQLPLLCGLPFLEKRASETAHFVVGRSGKHLSALHAFKRRVAYANANYDLSFLRTSSIRRQNELPKSNLLVLDEKYPHVVYIERKLQANPK